MVEKSVRLSLRDDPQEEGHQEVGCSTRPWTTVDPSPPIAIPTGIRLTEPPAPSAPPAGATAQHSLPRQNRAAPHQAHPVPSGKWKSMLAIQVSFRTYSALPSGSSTTARHSFHQFRQSGPEYAFEGEKLVGGGLPRRPPPAGATTPAIASRSLLFEQIPSVFEQVASAALVTSSPGRGARQFARRRPCFPELQVELSGARRVAVAAAAVGEGSGGNRRRDSACVPRCATTSRCRRPRTPGVVGDSDEDGATLVSG